MAKFYIDSQIITADLVVFDKDGVLIDFYALWDNKVRRSVQSALVAAGLPDTVANTLYVTLGYDPDSRRAAGGGPIAAATLVELADRVTVWLQEHSGLTVAEAWHIGHNVYLRELQALPISGEIQPLGNPAELFQQITAAGAQVAIVTSDERAGTELAIKELGVAQLVSAIVCADDPPAAKPAPDPFYYLQEQLQIPPQRMIMVGDNPSDLIAATRAGVGARVGVLSGTSVREWLAPHADTVIDDITGIQVTG